MMLLVNIVTGGGRGGARVRENQVNGEGGL